MPTFHGKGYVFGAGGTYTGYTPANAAMSSGYVTNKIPVAEGVNLTHNGEVEQVQGPTGEFTGIIITAEYLECTFEMRPEGSSIANAEGAATLPPLGATFVIAGLPVIAAGGFSDAFNVGGSSPNTNRWVYVGGGSIRMSNTAKAMVTLPLRRYVGIAPTTAITT